MAVMMRRSTSTDSTTSTGSLSLSPSGWMPSRSIASPPSITPCPISTTTVLLESTTLTAERRHVLSPEPSRWNLFSSNQAIAFPSWPISDAFSPLASSINSSSSYFSSSNEYVPNSRISDDDLEALDFTTPVMVACQPTELILAESLREVTNGGSMVIPQIMTRRSRLPPPPQQYRQRSSSKKARKPQKPLVVIAE